MRKFHLILSVAIAIGVLANAQEGAQSSPLNATWNVSVSNYVFTPSDISIAVGDTVTWTWAEGIHTVTANDSSFDSGIQSTVGHTFSQTFNTAGDVPYFCQLHVDPPFSMTGIIHVVAPTVTPTATSTQTATSSPTSTGTSVPTSTSTATATAVPPTSTPTATATPTGTSGPPTNTPTTTWTATGTPEPLTSTPTATSTVTETSVSLTNTPTATGTPVLPTNTPTATETQTSTPASATPTTTPDGATATTTSTPTSTPTASQTPAPDEPLKELIDLVKDYAGSGEINNPGLARLLLGTLGEAADAVQAGHERLASALVRAFISLVRASEEFGLISDDAARDLVRQAVDVLAALRP